MKREFIQTADGSTSIYLEDLDEHYHSKHGAIKESEHIFVQNGLLEKKKLSLITVLEVGMGTGLNVLTSLKAAREYNLHVNYHAIEAYPILREELQHINFSEKLEMEASLFHKIHSESWDKPIELTEGFNLIKHCEKLQDIKLDNNWADVIYFDAFAPEKQAEMWTEEIFVKLFEALKLGGILVTYCVKGEIRRRLQKVGFRVEKLKGPEGGKREMCRAWK